MKATPYRHIKLHQRWTPCAVAPECGDPLSFSFLSLLAAPSDNKTNGQSAIGVERGPWQSTSKRQANFVWSWKLWCGLSPSPRSQHPMGAYNEARDVIKGAEQKKSPYTGKRRQWAWKHSNVSMNSLRLKTFLKGKITAKTGLNLCTHRWYEISFCTSGKFIRISVIGLRSCSYLCTFAATDVKRFHTDQSGIATNKPFEVLCESKHSVAWKTSLLTQASPPSTVWLSYFKGACKKTVEKNSFNARAWKTWLAGY